MRPSINAPLPIENGLFNALDRWGGYILYIHTTLPIDILQRWVGPRHNCSK